VAISVALSAIPRIYLWLLYVGLVGRARFGDIEQSTWNVEHTFVATDLTSSGPFFLACNRIQPIVFSARCGFFDGRHISFRKALRASTAIPPGLPPTRFRLRYTRPPSQHTSLRHRPWLHQPEEGCPSSVWLVDGGVTGNLGIQLEPKFASENSDLQTFADAKVLAGLVPLDSYCAVHPDEELPVWICRKCDQVPIVVDSSGAKPRLRRALGLLLRVPGLRLLVNSTRSMSVMYEQALTVDQKTAGDNLVGVVRTSQILDRLAQKTRQAVDPTDAKMLMVEAGAMGSWSEHIAGELRKLTPLLHACWKARLQAAKVKTWLWTVDKKLAARTIASGYLNAYVNEHGPDSWAGADAGMRDLDTLLGGGAGLAEWWALIAQPFNDA